MLIFFAVFGNRKPPSRTRFVRSGPALLLVFLAGFGFQCLGMFAGWGKEDPPFSVAPLKTNSARYYLRFVRGLDTTRAYQGSVEIRDEISGQYENRTTDEEGRVPVRIPRAYQGDLPLNLRFQPAEGISYSYQLELGEEAQNILRAEYSEGEIIRQIPVADLARLNGVSDQVYSQSLGVDGVGFFRNNEYFFTSAAFSELDGYTADTPVTNLTQSAGPENLVDNLSQNLDLVGVALDPAGDILFYGDERSLFSRPRTGGSVTDWNLPVFYARGFAWLEDRVYAVDRGTFSDDPANLIWRENLSADWSEPVTLPFLGSPAGLSVWGDFFVTTGNLVDTYNSDSGPHVFVLNPGGELMALVTLENPPAGPDGALLVSAGSTDYLNLLSQGKFIQYRLEWQGDTP